MHSTKEVDNLAILSTKNIDNFQSNEREDFGAHAVALLASAHAHEAYRIGIISLMLKRRRCFVRSSTCSAIRGNDQMDTRILVARI